MGIFDEVRAVSKPQHKRNKPKGKDRGKFSDKTIKAILERDDNKCVRCGSYYVESVPHHIIYKGGKCGPGTKWNGATICRNCHKWAHGLMKGPNGEPEKEGRYWFLNWQETKLNSEGDLLHD